MESFESIDHLENQNPLSAPSDSGDLGIIQTFMEVSHAFPSEDFSKNEPTRVEEQPFIPCSNRKIQTMDRHAQHEHVRLKLQLDAESDFTTHNNQICFHQSFETVSARETFCTTPEDVIESCRALLDVNLNDTVAKVVREYVHITIGCNTFPLFSLISVKKICKNIYKWQEKVGFWPKPDFPQKL